MGTVDEFFAKGGFTAEELISRDPSHVATADEDNDPRRNTGDDLPEDTAGWDVR